MLTLEELRSRLGLPDTIVAQDESEIRISKDLCDWVMHLAYPCEVPYTIAPSEVLPDNPQAPAVILTIGPEGTPWVRYEVAFTRAGSWLSVTSVGRSETSSALPAPELGYTAAEAAHMIGIEMERTWFRSPWSWNAYRKKQKNDGGDPWQNDLADQQKRIQHLARLKVTSQVQLAALEALAHEYPEEYEKHLEAQRVLKALSSDWYPDSRVQ